MSNGTAASGSRILLGMAREARWGEPSSEPLTFRRPVLPFAAEFLRVENPSGEVSPAGWKVAGLPGAVTGPVDLGVSFVAGDSLDLFEHVLRGSTKTELEAGAVWQYDFEQDPFAPETSFRLAYAFPPVDRALVYGVRFSSIAQEIGNNTPIQSRLAGQAGHGTRIGAAVADAANLGTWTGRPWLRGIMADPTAGDIHVRVVRDVAGGGLQFTVEVTDAAPTFPGAPVDVVYSALDGHALWLNLQDEAGRDVGIWSTINRDPVEILFQGTAADHADIQVGDTWRFPKPLTWPDPVPTYLAGQRYTSANLLVDYRLPGTADWIELFADGGNVGNVNIGWPATVGSGNASKYPTSMDRDGESVVTLQLVRKFRDLTFQFPLEKHERVELRLRWLGQQIGSHFEWRESVVYEFPAVQLTVNRAVSNPTAIIETIDGVAEGGPAGEPPVLISVITAQDWTPFAEL